MFGLTWEWEGNLMLIGVQRKGLQAQAKATQSKEHTLKVARDDPYENEKGLVLVKE